MESASSVRGEVNDNQTGEGSRGKCQPSKLTEGRGEGRCLDVLEGRVDIQVL